MAENMAQEIRELEAKAKELVAQAKSDAAHTVAQARADAEQSVKETKQRCHREWRENVAAAEREAEAHALEITEKGDLEAADFYKSRKKLTEETANWLVKEVKSAYGTC